MAWEAGPQTNHGRDCQEHIAKAAWMDHYDCLAHGGQDHYSDGGIRGSRDRAASRSAIAFTL
ncbi:MAG: hypothetical protein JW384_00624 [Nitrosomonadaceae bacterium]|nr:hypothetical protein [Nitrosomonadaceae bacterium]